MCLSIYYAFLICITVANEDAYSFWVANYLVNGVRWKYELCSLVPTLAPGSYVLPHQYTCVSACETYLNNNPDVDDAYLDPVFHFQVCAIFKFNLLLIPF